MSGGKKKEKQNRVRTTSKILTAKKGGKKERRFCKKGKEGGVKDQRPDPQPSALLKA